MKNVYFVNHDFNMERRHSDGVEFCVIPEFYDEKIYFYCSEYSMFWSDIKDTGDFDKCLDFKLKKEIRPATLEEISNFNLCRHVDAIKEYITEGGKVIKTTYIHLK